MPEKIHQMRLRLGFWMIKMGQGRLWAQGRKLSGASHGKQAGRFQQDPREAWDILADYVLKIQIGQQKMNSRAFGEGGKKLKN
jgi:hypothetical protein